MVQSMKYPPWRVLEVNGGRVEQGDSLRFRLPPGDMRYADAQIDDYGRPGGRFLWRPGTVLCLRARFSHESNRLRGTAGFGFWNAPYGDPSRRRPVLPQAAWFFFGSEPNDLPFAPASPGRGWFAASLDAGTPAAIGVIPFAPIVLALNQFAPIRRRLWPVIRRRLGIHSASVDADMTEFHEYRLDWLPDSVRFQVDGRVILVASPSPRGPLGFVCWLDNQYLVLTPRGRFRAGVLPVATEQWLEVDGLRLETIDTLSTSP